MHKHYILLICKVLLHLLKSYFCNPILKTACFVTTEHGYGYKYYKRKRQFATVKLGSIVAIGILIERSHN